MRALTPLLLAAMVLVVLCWRPLARLARLMFGRVGGWIRSRAILARMAFPSWALALVLASVTIGGVAIARNFITLTWGASSTSSVKLAGASTTSNYFATPQQGFGINCEVTVASPSASYGSLYVGCSEDNVTFAPVTLGTASNSGTDGGTNTWAFATSASVQTKLVNFILPANVPCNSIAVGVNDIADDGGTTVACQESSNLQ